MLKVGRKAGGIAAALVLLVSPACRVHADAPPTTAGAAKPAAPSSIDPAQFDPDKDCSLWRDGTFGDNAPAPSLSFLWDDLSIFGGLDGSKEPEDLGVNAHFGMRGAVSWGVPLVESWGLGAELGGAANYSNNAVRVLQGLDGVHDDFQAFATAGFFQRSSIGLNWGFVYDVRFDDYYANVTFTQWRGQVGYALNPNNELGLWGALRDRGEPVQTLGQTFELRPITQGDLYWRHVWENDIVTRFWVGMAESHGRFLLVAPGESPVHHPVTFGAELYVPLTDRLAIFGEANFITPNDTGTVDATLGFAFYPGAGARRTAHSRFAPLLPTANNATFPVDLRQ